jgi:dTMP kinase
MKRGKLINLEGLDGAGKSTQIKLLKKYFEDQNKSVKKIHFPMYGHNQFSDIITRFLKGDFGNLDEVDPLFVANIYAMDRYMYKEQLIKDLEENDVVILDRFVFSNLAFQGAKIKDEKKRKEIVEWIWKFEFDFLSLPYPDLMIFFDVPLDTIEERLNKNRVGDDRDYLDGGKDIHEQDMKFQSNVRNVYYSIKDRKNYHIVSAFENDNLLTPNNLFNKYKNLI